MLSWNAIYQKSTFSQRSTGTNVKNGDPFSCQFSLNLGTVSLNVRVPKTEVWFVSLPTQKYRKIYVSPRFTSLSPDFRNRIIPLFLPSYHAFVSLSKFYFNRSTTW